MFDYFSIEYGAFYLIMITIPFIPTEMADIRYIPFLPCDIEMDVPSVQLEYSFSSKVIYSESYRSFDLHNVQLHTASTWRTILEYMEGCVNHTS